MNYNTKSVNTGFEVLSQYLSVGNLGPKFGYLLDAAQDQVVSSLKGKLRWQCSIDQSRQIGFEQAGRLPIVLAGAPHQTRLHIWR